MTLDRGASRIVVAMSGGVDSSVVAALLKERGHEVIGVTLQLYDHGAATRASRTCCAGQDIHDARRVAEALDIPHYVLNYERRFADSVIAPFADSYRRGETPIPCAMCNQTVKFRDLMKTARDLGADAMATGHYVRRADGPGEPRLLRAIAEGRDQSYFLFTTTPAQLAFLRFPLGAMDKNETRALARRYALPVAEKPDSQDICFVPDRDYAGAIERLRPGAAEPGDIVDTEGYVRGRHEGVVHFTVGQRRGLGIGGGGAPLYVVAIDAVRRRVVVGPKAALGRTLVRLREVNWLAADAREAAEAGGVSASVKLRSRDEGRAATIRIKPDGACEVELAAPAEGVAPGQACVFYDGERLLGGGWIAAANAPRQDLRAAGYAA